MSILLLLMCSYLSIVCEALPLSVESMLGLHHQLQRSWWMKCDEDVRRGNLGYV